MIKGRGRIVQATEPWTWYRDRIGEEFYVEYDPCFDAFVTLNKGAGRYIMRGDIEIIEKDEL